MNDTVRPMDAMGTVILRGFVIYSTWICFCWVIVYGFDPMVIQAPLFTTIWENMFGNVSNH